MTYSTGNTTTWYYIFSQKGWGLNCAIRTKLQFNAAASGYGCGFGFSNTDVTKIAGLLYNGTYNYIRAISPESTALTTNCDTSNNIYDITLTPTTLSAIKNEIAMTNSPITTNVPNGFLNVSISNLGTSTYKLTSDWILVRKYTATLPTTSIGSQTTNDVAIVSANKPFRNAMSTL